MWVVTRRKNKEMKKKVHELPVTDRRVGADSVRGMADYDYLVSRALQYQAKVRVIAI